MLMTADIFMLWGICLAFLREHLPTCSAAVAIGLLLIMLSAIPIRSVSNQRKITSSESDDDKGKLQVYGGKAELLRDAKPGQPTDSAASIPVADCASKGSGSTHSNLLAQSCRIVTNVCASLSGEDSAVVERLRLPGAPLRVATLDIGTSSVAAVIAARSEAAVTIATVPGSAAHTAPPWASTYMAEPQSLPPQKVVRLQVIPAGGEHVCCNSGGDFPRNETCGPTPGAGPEGGFSSAHKPSSSAAAFSIKSCFVLETSSPASVTTATATAAPAARLNARRIALNAKLAGHPMPSLAHYNCAMELTRQIDKSLVYPSPHARGRSAYKIPGCEPEDAPDGWRDQIARAMLSVGGKVTSGGGGNATGVHDSVVGCGDGSLWLDAAYLRRGCIMLVVEYSRRRLTSYSSSIGAIYSGTEAAGASKLLGAAAAAGSIYDAGSMEGSSPGLDTVEALKANGQTQTVPALLHHDLLQAFGPQLLKPEGIPVKVGVQHFSGPTGGDFGGLRQLLDLNVMEPHMALLSKQGCGEDISVLATDLPRMVLLGPPCVLTSNQPFCLHVRTYDPPSGLGVSGITSAAQGAQDGGVPRAGQCAAAVATSSKLPRLLVRYGCLDAAPQPCFVLSNPKNGNFKRDDQPLSSLETLPGLFACGDMSADETDEKRSDDLLQPAQMLQVPAAQSACGGTATGVQVPASAIGGWKEGTADCLYVLAGPCPRPGLLLLEMEMEMDVHTEAAVETEEATQGTEGMGVVDIPLAMAVSHMPLLSSPLPVVVIDDTAVQNEVNAVAMAAMDTMQVREVGTAADFVSADGTAAAATPPMKKQQPPDWLLAFLYDLGQFLELATTAGERASVQDGFVPLSNPARGTVVGGLERRESGTLIGRTLIEGMDMDSDSGSWSTADGEEGMESGFELGEMEEERLLCLAANLTAYACRQSLPSLLSYVLSRVDGLGIPLSLLDDEVEDLYGGMGLAHLGVLSGSTEVLQTLIMQARMWAAAPPKTPSLPRFLSATRRGRYDSRASALHCCGEMDIAVACLDGNPLHEQRQDVTEVSNGDANGYNCLGGPLSSMNACTALFVRPACSGVTALHLLALSHSLSPDLAETVLSLCPLVGHAWFGVCDDGGSSPAWYAQQAGTEELNEQCKEMLAMEALEAKALGCDEPDKMLAIAVSMALNVGNLLTQAPTNSTEPSAPISGEMLDKGSVVTLSCDGELYGNAPPHIRGAVGGGPTAVDTSATPDTLDLTMQLPPQPLQRQAPDLLPGAGSSLQGDAGSDSSRGSRSKSWPLRISLGNFVRRRTAAMRRLPWAAPLMGFTDPSLERAFACRTGVLALQRNRFALAFNLVVIAGCVQKFLVARTAFPPHPLLSLEARWPGAILLMGELLAAAGPPLSKLCANILVWALRLQGTAHDLTLAAGGMVQGMIVGAVHIIGRPHPEAFEVADLAMQEALVSLHHCILHPVMEQMSSPFFSLCSAIICASMELPMAVNHGWRGPMAVALLSIRFLVALAMRYSLAVWCRASYLEGAAGGDRGGPVACRFGGTSGISVKDSKSTAGSR